MPSDPDALTTPETSPTPTYADRPTGATYAGPSQMVEAYLARYGERHDQDAAHLDALGYAQIKRGHVYIGVNVLEESGGLMILAPISEVPATGREAFYRRLLELSFLATADAAFAIDAKKDVVYARALRRLSGLDYEEFEDLVDTVGGVAEGWKHALSHP